MDNDKDSVTNQSMKKFDIEDFDFDIILNSVIKHKNDNGKYSNLDYQIPLNVIKPSSIGLCKRLIILDEFGFSGEPDEDLRKIFYHGNYIHDNFAYPTLKYFFEDVLHIKNAVVINEYPLTYEIEADDGTMLKVKGYIDDLILINDEWYPIEIKSIGNKFYKLVEPAMEHQAQVMMYLHNKGKKFGYVVYIHKGTLNTKTFRVEYDEEIYKKLESRAKELYMYKSQGIIPEAEAMIAWEDRKDIWFKGVCDHCRHLGLCLQLGKDKVKSE